MQVLIDNLSAYAAHAILAGDTPALMPLAGAALLALVVLPAVVRLYTPALAPLVSLGAWLLVGLVVANTVSQLESAVFSQFDALMGGW